jgi:DNA-binding NarL/FixJ family response regulator
LTPRQREIVQLIAEGKSTKEIAFLLKVSVKTVEAHRTQLMERLGIREVAGRVRCEATRWCAAVWPDGSTSRRTWSFAARPRTSREGVAAAARLGPDLAIVDLTLGQESGLRLVGLLLEKVPGLAILVLSTHEEDLFALPALRAGARGFVMHQDATNVLLNAIRDVLADKIYLSPNLRRRFWRETWGNRRHPEV